MAEEDKAEQTQAEQECTVVYLGNRKAVLRVDGGRDPDPGKKCTTVVFPGERSLMEATFDITGPQGIWANMSDAPAPAWVAAEGPLAGPLTQLLSAHYKCEVREPDPDGTGA